MDIDLGSISLTSGRTIALSGVGILPESAMLYLILFRAFLSYGEFSIKAGDLSSQTQKG